jgi:hypothetical protein
MATFGSGKLIPPPHVLEEDLADRIETKVRATITERILREAKIDDQVAAAIAGIGDVEPDISEIEAWLEENAEDPWTPGLTTSPRRSPGVRHDRIAPLPAGYHRSI